jgi:hypothetical protein
MPRYTRVVRHTLNIVGEGASEVTLLKHVRSLYLSRTGNIAVTVSNARGGGGRGVLRYALSPRTRNGFDEMAMLFDTDTDWDDELRQHAVKKGVRLLESEPCLEAWLLQIHGYATDGAAVTLKREFANRFGGDASDQRVYERHFQRQVLDRSRAAVPTLAQLLRLMRV